MVRGQLTFDPGVRGASERPGCWVHGQDVSAGTYLRAGRTGAKMSHLEKRGGRHRSGEQGPAALRKNTYGL